ncbi:NAD(P)-binding protein [Ceratobasidium sp. AG-I]|nr:NAD(P)-binding protein [Ceratobasidium sp. AG-I]
MKSILVVGATGQQGSSVVRALSQSGRYHVLALTRNTSSHKAQQLAALSNVQLVSADLNHIDQLRTVFLEARDSAEGSIWGVFVALAFPGLGVNAAEEEKQGKTVADIAAEFGVDSFIYTSTIKYLPEEEHAPEPGLDRHAKVLIENHVQSLDFSWTILRLGFFMENLSPGMIGRMTEGMLRYCLAPEVKVQMIAVEDVGPISCAVFDDPPKFRRKALDVAGGSLTAEERNQSHIRATGHPIPSVPGYVMSVLHWLNHHVQGTMQELRLADQTRRQDPRGYDANLQEVASHVKLTTFEEWVREAHEETGKEVNLNGVSLWSLITGKL